MEDEKKEKLKPITLLLEIDQAEKLEAIGKKEKWSKALTYRKMLSYWIEEYERIQEILKNAKR